MGTCSLCGSELPDLGVVCYGCAARLISALKAVPELMDDLAITLEKRSRVAAPSGPTRTQAEMDPVVLPFNLAASHAKAELLGVLTSWACLIRDERRVRYERRDGQGNLTRHEARTPLTCELTCTALAGWIGQYIRFLRHHPAGGDAVVEICDAVNSARRTIDTPRQKVLVGRCFCTSNLWINDGDDQVECPSCGHVHNVRAVRSANLGQLRDRVGYREEIATALTANGRYLTAALIHKWWQRGLLKETRRDERGRKMYRLGDVQDLFEQQAAKRTTTKPPTT